MRSNAAFYHPLSSVPEEITISSLSRTLQIGEVSSLSLTSHYLEHSEHRKDLNAYITTTSDLAIRQAEAADQRYRDKKPLSPIDGIPIAVKDNFCMEGILTTAGSRILANFVAPYESTVTQRLIDAGAVILGKTNLDEFGMGSSTETSFFGPTINPLGLAKGLGDLVPGGSSGGSAAAVAAGLCSAAIGTDTGGSIRQPASFCGIVGMKPTYGLCSRWGIIAYASSLDQAGVLTRNVDDAATLLDIMVAHDTKDSTSISFDSKPFTESLTESISNKIIGVPKEFLDVEAGGDLHATWGAIFSTFQRAGFTVKTVSLPTMRYALPAYYVIALSEASSNLARYDGIRFGYRSPQASTIEDLYKLSRAEGFGAEVQRRILMGTYSLSEGYYDAYYLKAQKIRRLISNEVQSALKGVAALVWPTTPSPAFALGSFSSDPTAMYLEDIFTVPVNMVGMPAINIPIATARNGMPMGATIAGPLLGDAEILKIAKAVETQMTIDR